MDEEPRPILQNVVSTVSVGCKLDLKSLALRARNAEYNPKRFSACTLRIKEPKTTALVFATGKIVITGAKSKQNSHLAARKFVRMIQKLGHQVKGFFDFKVQNMVGSCGLEFPIRLELLACTHGGFIKYEPEIFPGLVYRMMQPKVTLLIFASGKVVIAGAKVAEEIDAAFENIYPVLCEYRKIIPPQPLPPQTFQQYEAPDPQTPQPWSMQDEADLNAMLDQENQQYETPDTIVIQQDVAYPPPVFMEQQVYQQRDQGYAVDLCIREGSPDPDPQTPQPWSMQDEADLNAMLDQENQQYETPDTIVIQQDVAYPPPVFMEQQVYQQREQAEFMQQQCEQAVFMPPVFMQQVDQQAETSVFMQQVDQQAGTPVFMQQVDQQAGTPVFMQQQCEQAVFMPPVFMQQVDQQAGTPVFMQQQCEQAAFMQQVDQQAGTPVFMQQQCEQAAFMPPVFMQQVNQQAGTSQLRNPPVFMQQVDPQAGHIPPVPMQQLHQQAGPSQGPQQQRVRRRKAPVCRLTPQEMLAKVNDHNAMVQAKYLQVA